MLVFNTGTFGFVDGPSTTVSAVHEWLNIAHLWLLFHLDLPLQMLLSGRKRVRNYAHWLQATGNIKREIRQARSSWFPSCDRSTFALLDWLFSKC